MFLHTGCILKRKKKKSLIIGLIQCYSHTGTTYSTCNDDADAQGEFSKVTVDDGKLLC